MLFKIFLIRATRKAFHIANRFFRKAASFTYRVEDKATRILTGRDFSRSIIDEIPFEKAFYNGLPYNIAPLNPALPAIGRQGKVTLLIPSLNKGSFYGGTATALIVAAKLSKELRRKLRIVETLQPGGKTGLSDFYRDNNLDIREADVELIDVSSRRYNIYGYLDLHEDDVFMASAWWDAYLLNILPLKKKYVYLIQDFEPIFYANSDKYLLAENTYKTDKFIPLCNTELMYDFMAKRYHYIKEKGLWFEPAVSQSAGGLSIRNKGKRKIFLYGRVNVERNLFYSGIYALNEVFGSQKLSVNEWEIFMAGQDYLPDITLSSGIGVQNLGKMSMHQYRKFARTIDLTISLMMAPHPNYPTLELASVGSSVVTTKYENKQSLSHYSPNIYMSELSLEDIQQQIVKASQLSYEQRIENLSKNHILESWDKSLEEPLQKIFEEIKRTS